MITKIIVWIPSARVSVEGKEANYLRLQLSNRIDARKISGVTASVVNSVVYLEKE